MPIFRMVILIPIWWYTRLQLYLRWCHLRVQILPLCARWPLQMVFPPTSCASNLYRRTIAVTKCCLHTTAKMLICFYLFASWQYDEEIMKLREFEVWHILECYYTLIAEVKNPPKTIPPNAFDEWAMKMITFRYIWMPLNYRKMPRHYCNETDSYNIDIGCTRHADATPPLIEPPIRLHHVSNATCWRIEVSIT